METLERLKIAKEMEDPYYFKDPKLLELYKRSLPPKEAYYHFPPPDEIIRVNQKKPKKSFRQIYYNVPFTDFENQWLIQFKQILSNHPETQLPDYFADYLLLGFIYADHCDLEKSYKHLLKYLEFCKETFPVVITPKSKVREILNRGFVYVYGRDSRFRPIVVCECTIFQKYYKLYSTPEILSAVFFLCQYVVNNMIIPGQFEAWTFILNLSGVSVLSLPEPAKKIIPGLSDYFLGRLYKAYIFGLNFITRIIYKITCAFLDPITVSKVVILDEIGDPKLFDRIRKDNVEQKFGGTANNLPVDEVDGFFPPRMPSEYFIKENENPNDILISEDEYINRYKSGQIPDCCVSPFIYEKLKLIEKEKQEKLEEIKNNEENKINEEKNQKQQSEEMQEKINKIKFEEKRKLDMIRMKKNIEKERLQNFINYNWNYEEELSMTIYNNINCNKLNNITNEINKFGDKRRNFFLKISSFK
jgi:hypothetical protein